MLAPPLNLCCINHFEDPSKKSELLLRYPINNPVGMILCVSGMDISYRVQVPSTLYSREY